MIFEIQKLCLPAYTQNHKTGIFKNLHFGQGFQKRLLINIINPKHRNTWDQRTKKPEHDRTKLESQEANLQTKNRNHKGNTRQESQGKYTKKLKKHAQEQNTEIQTQDCIITTTRTMGN